jgi:hypothetical protein
VYAQGECDACEEEILIYLNNYDNLDDVLCPLCHKGKIIFIRINGKEVE